MNVVKFPTSQSAETKSSSLSGERSYGSPTQQELDVLDDLKKQFPDDQIPYSSKSEEPTIGAPYLAGMRDAFIAMANVEGVIGAHVLQAMLKAGVTPEELGSPPAIVRLQENDTSQRLLREEYLSSLPSDFDIRRST